MLWQAATAATAVVVIPQIAVIAFSTGTGVQIQEGPQRGLVVPVRIFNAFEIHAAMLRPSFSKVGEISLEAIDFLSEGSNDGRFHIVVFRANRCRTE